MRDHDLAYQFFCTWRILGKEERIRTSSGVLDSAIDCVVGAYDEFKDYFPVIDGRLGRECVVLPELIDLAVDAGVIAPISPGFTYHGFEVSKLGARGLLRREIVPPRFENFVGDVIEEYHKELELFYLER